MASTEPPKLEIQQHIKYWQRCLNSLLPNQYTGVDSTRMTFGFFILSALDILNAGPDTFPQKRRKEIREWILNCQHPSGGFCGSPNHKYPDEYYAHGNKIVDPANLPATFFAVLSLSYVGGLDEINREKTLRWLRTVQRKDGSFGELVTEDGVIEGGRDMRCCYVAAAVRWLLRGESDEVEDIDVDGMVGHIRSGQTYDGGISESSEHEAHAGYTYCAIASLSFLDRLPNSPSKPTISKQGLTNIPATIRWLVSRQLGYNKGDDEEKAEKIDHGIKLAGINEKPLVPGLTLQDEHFVGFNGRCNKNADTCYAFWVGASLDMLGHENQKLLNSEGIRRFLFEQTQHRIGGFGKTPGDPPDVYHAYLGLAALATMREPGIKPLDSALCISVQQKQLFVEMRKSILVRVRTYWKHGYCFSIREDDPDFEKKMKDSEEVPKGMKESLDVVAQLGTVNI